MDQELFKAYADLKRNEKNIKKLIDELSPKVLAAVQETGNLELPTDYGTFRVKTTRKYEYPEEVIALQESVNLKKTEAEALGTASYTEKTFVEFRMSKDTAE